VPLPALTLGTDTQLRGTAATMRKSPALLGHGSAARALFSGQTRASRSSPQTGASRSNAVASKGSGCNPGLRPFGSLDRYRHHEMDANFSIKGTALHGASVHYAARLVVAARSGTALRFAPDSRASSKPTTCGGARSSERRSRVAQCDLKRRSVFAPQARGRRPRNHYPRTLAVGPGWPN
jgi:hypothetical protein